MNNILKDIQLTSDDQYPSNTSVSMIVASRPIPMQNAAITVALMLSGLVVGFQSPHEVIQLSVAPPTFVAHDAARGDEIVIKHIHRNAVRTRGFTRTVQHKVPMSTFLEDDTHLAKVARSVTKVKGKTRLGLPAK